MIGALSVYVTDAALGIGITDRARRSPGTFIVEGIWHGGGHYEIRDAGFAAATPDELAAMTHLEVERGD
jgi:hypothetical protein